MTSTHFCMILIPNQRKTKFTVDNTDYLIVYYLENINEKRFKNINLDNFFPFLVFSQDVLISDGGTINICNGTFYDSGGPNGVYYQMKIIQLLYVQKAQLKLFS